MNPRATPTLMTCILNLLSERKGNLLGVWEEWNARGSTGRYRDTFLLTQWGEWGPSIGDAGVRPGWGFRTHNSCYTLIATAAVM